MRNQMPHTPPFQKTVVTLFMKRNNFLYFQVMVFEEFIHPSLSKRILAYSYAEISFELFLYQFFQRVKVF